MVPTPVAHGLTLCDYVIIERNTGKVSLIGNFREITLSDFPGVLPPFVVSTVLTDGAGSGMLELVVSRLETDEDLFTYARPVQFPDQLSELRIILRLTRCSIP